MILRPISLLCLVAAAGAGLHLYTTKHEVALLDRELRGIAARIDAAKERSQALSAEWAWLNEPDRLRAVAQRHLTLEPMQPAQFLRLNEAERKLPAVAAYDGPTALFAERAPTTPGGPAVQLALLPRMTDAVQVARQVTTEPPPPAPPVAVPVPVEAAPPPRAPVVLALPAAPTRPAEPPRRAETVPHLADAHPIETPRPVPRPAPPRPAPRQAPELAALPPIAAPSRPVMAQIAAPVARPAVTQVAATVPMPREAPAVSLGSALGSALSAGRAMLPPPVPFGSANAATLGGGR